MKKIISIFLIIIISILILQACCTCNESVDASTSMFIIIENKINNDYFIVYHKDTKVMYAVSNATYNRGNFTLLVDSDGKPMLYDGGIK